MNSEKWLAKQAEAANNIAWADDRELIARAHGYLSRLFVHYAPQCEPLPDLMGVCTQIDNLLAGLVPPKPDVADCQCPRVGETPEAK